MSACAEQLGHSPAEEVVLAALVLVPDGDLELLADPREEVEVELLQPPRVQRLVDGLRLVAVVAQPIVCRNTVIFVKVYAQWLLMSWGGTIHHKKTFTAYGTHQS